MSLHPFQPSEQLSAQIVCPKCAALGVVIWERIGVDLSLVNLPNGFYERIANRKPDLLELIYHRCGTAQGNGLGTPSTRGDAYAQTMV
jgi:hypothetical protein